MKADDKFSCRIFYDTQGQKLEELLAFPIDPSMMKQVEGKTPDTVADQALPEATAEEAPPKIVPKHLTGRIHPSWKGNGK